MSIEYIRKAYGINCRVGQRVRYHPPGKAPTEGTILGATGAYLKVRLDTLQGIAAFHPTWCLTLLDEDADETMAGRTTAEASDGRKKN